MGNVTSFHSQKQSRGLYAQNVNDAINGGLMVVNLEPLRKLGRNI